MPLFIRKYSVNENFFENINSPNEAYCLGLWYADGYNCPIDNRIGIEMKDLDIIEKLKSCLEYTGPIHKRLFKNPNHNVQYKLRISSKKLCIDLIKWGCFPRKSTILRFPNNINNNFMSHFLRGLFDGDGTIGSHIKHKNNKKYWSLGIVGTKDICEGIKNYLNYGNIYINYKNPKTKHITYEWRISSNQNIINFLNYIYKDATIYLDRKFAKYQEFLNGTTRK